ncbi:MAG TPA: response regulator [Thermoanaerobaculia bacterium]|jgi:CheY-like chemotaxis protein
MTRIIHPILIVEDDPPTQMLLETLMQRYGFVSVTAGNGAAAIDQLSARDFTLIILDLMMPEVGGSDVIKYLARQNRRVPVIVCTAAGLDKTGEFAPGVVDAVLRKPFDIEVLMTTIFDLAGLAMPSKVLIVDEDARSRYALKALLAPAESFEAESGADALLKIREHRPDAVVSAIAVGSVIEEMAAEGIPVVVIVPAALGNDDRAALQGAAGVIARPDLSRQSLTDVFDTVLGRG